MKATRTETECKLVAPDAKALKPLRRALKRLARSADYAGVARIEDVYLDTVHWAFYRHGYACRIRLAGDEAMLTLKTGVHLRDRVSVRREYEERLPLPLPEPLDSIPARRLGRKIRELTRGQPVRELFRIRNRRRVYRIRTDDGLAADVSADDFHVIAANSTLHLAEVEIEQTRGGYAALTQFAEELALAMKLQIGGRGKFRTGLKLGGYRPPPFTARSE